MDSAEAFGDPPCMTAVGEANPAGVLLFPLLPPVGDNNVAVAFVATLQLALDVNGALDVDEVVYVGGGVYPNGGAGWVYDDGYGPVAVRTGDWSALWQAAPHVEFVASWIQPSQVENCDSSTPQ